MAEVINLRSVKKQAARKAARAKGDENAVKFGRSKAERELQQAQVAKAERDLDGKKRETD
jgi:hypothetical protein